MPDISAAAVKALRDKTNLPMMDCKKALEATGGDPEAAVKWLHEQGKKTYEKRAGRETTFGRIAVLADLPKSVGAMVELRCESTPVMGSESFIQLANDLVSQLAYGPGAATPDALLDQPSPSQKGKTLRQQMDDLFNQIREVFRVPRIERINAPCAGYAHHNGAVGVLLQIDGKTDATLGKDFCMHVAAMRPQVLSPDQLDSAAVEREREAYREAARKEGKPEKILEKIVDGKMKDFYAQHCLTEQPFVKDTAKSVGKVANDAGMKLVRFVHWELA